MNDTSYTLYITLYFLLFSHLLSHHYDTRLASTTEDFRNISRAAQIHGGGHSHLPVVISFPHRTRLVCCCWEPFFCSFWTSGLLLIYLKQFPKQSTNTVQQSINIFHLVLPVLPSYQLFPSWVLHLYRLNCTVLQSVHSLTRPEDRRQKTEDREETPNHSNRHRQQLALITLQARDFGIIAGTLLSSRSGACNSICSRIAAPRLPLPVILFICCMLYAVPNCTSICWQLRSTPLPFRRTILCHISPPSPSWIKKTHLRKSAVQQKQPKVARDV